MSSSCLSSFAGSPLLSVPFSSSFSALHFWLLTPRIFRSSDKACSKLIRWSLIPCVWRMGRSIWAIASRGEILSTWISNRSAIFPAHHHIQLSSHSGGLTPIFRERCPSNASLAVAKGLSIASALTRFGGSGLFCHVSANANTEAAAPMDSAQIPTRPQPPSDASHSTAAPTSSASSNPKLTTPTTVDVPWFLKSIIRISKPASERGSAAFWSTDSVPSPCSLPIF
mmetsp:Transcript_50608/g.99558  ORF Transcript_50608/g.99558 Transcript_50608/m.99558 type:complete len:226 (+) Transcript_50608:354-1031(+)